MDPSEQARFLASGGDWWYSNAALFVIVLALLGAAAIVFLLYRRDLALLSTVLLAHTFVFVLNSRLPAVASAYILPLLVVPILSSRARDTDRRLALRPLKRILAFLLLSVLVCSARAFFEASKEYTGEDFAGALRFLLWGIVPTLAVLTLGNHEVPRQCRTVFKVLAVAGILLAAQLLVSIATGLLRGNSLLDVLSGRNAGGFVHIPMGGSNTIAAVLALSVVCGWGELRNGVGPIWRIILLASVAASLLAIFATLSRGATASLLIVAVVTFLRSRAASLTAVLGAATILATLGWLVLESPEIQNSAIYARILGRDIVTGGPGPGDWSGNRFLLWAGAARTFANNPLTGTGYLNHSALVLFGEKDAHNVELNVLYQLGLIGFVPFLWLCGHLIWIKHKLLRDFPWMSSDPIIKTFHNLQLLMLMNMQIESPEESAQYFMYIWVLLVLFVRYVKWLETCQATTRTPRRPGPSNAQGDLRCAFR